MEPGLTPNPWKVYQEILTVISEETGFTAAELTTKRTRGRIMEAKHIAAASLRAFGYSYPECGRVIGKDHTTVMHSCREVGERPKWRKDTARVVAVVEKRLGVSAHA